MRSFGKVKKLMKRRYIKAEVEMAVFIIQHNTFFSLSDHMSQYIKQEFKVSKAAEKFACGQTKTRQ